MLCYVAHTAGEEPASEGVKRPDLINWYLEQIADDLESEEELIEKKQLVDKVVDRLIHRVRWIDDLLGFSP